MTLLTLALTFTVAAPADELLPWPALQAANLSPYSPIGHANPALPPVQTVPTTYSPYGARFAPPSSITSVESVPVVRDLASVPTGTRPYRSRPAYLPAYDPDQLRPVASASERAWPARGGRGAARLTWAR